MKETPSVHELLRVAKDLHAAQEQCKCLQHTYKVLLGGMSGGHNGVFHVIDRDRVVWRLQWNGGYPTVERVSTLDVLDEDQSLPQENVVVSDDNDDGARDPLDF